MSTRMSACLEASLYILRGFGKLIITFFIVKNILKLINQQLKNGVKQYIDKIINFYFYVEMSSYFFFLCKMSSYFYIEILSYF